MTSPLARCLLVLVVLVVGESVRAQSHLAPRPGPFVVVDLYASPFQLGLERKAVGGAVGYRVGGGIDLALRVEHESEEVFAGSSGGVIELPGQTLVGVEAALAFGPDRGRGGRTQRTPQRVGRRSRTAGAFRRPTPS